MDYGNLLSEHYAPPEGVKVVVPRNPNKALAFWSAPVKQEQRFIVLEDGSLAKVKLILCPGCGRHTSAFLVKATDKERQVFQALTDLAKPFVSATCELGSRLLEGPTADRQPEPSPLADTDRCGRACSRAGGSEEEAMSDYAKVLQQTFTPTAAYEAKLREAAAGLAQSLEDFEIRLENCVLAWSRLTTALDLFFHVLGGDYDLTSDTADSTDA